MSMTFRVLMVLLTASLFCTGCGKPPRQLYEKAGGFSYDPPSGWEIVEVPGLKYRVSYGPQESEFAPNINVVDEAFAGTLTAYVDANFQSLEKMFVKMRVLSREDFKTHDGESAAKIVTEIEQHGHMLRQTFFFIGSGKRMYVVTCTALADGGDKFDTAFSESVKTFRIH